MTKKYFSLLGKNLRKVGNAINHHQGCMDITLHDTAYFAFLNGSFDEVVANMDAFLDEEYNLLPTNHAITKPSYALMEISNLTDQLGLSKEKQGKILEKLKEQEIINQDVQTLKELEDHFFALGTRFKEKGY